MKTSQENSKKMMWPTLATMAFSIVWGFGNVVNGFIYFDGTKVILSWIIIFLLFFIPYALMVGELGSVFQNSEGGDRKSVVQGKSVDLGGRRIINKQ